MASIISFTLKTLLFLCFCSFHFPLSTSSESNPSFPKEALPNKHGYLPISPTSTSSIFYAFYEAQNSTLPLSQTPLLIWLQGGPGCSSMIGNLYELGPWRITESLTLQRNLGAWNRVFGLLFFNMHLFPFAPLFLWDLATYSIFLHTLSLAPLQP